jgi:GPR1/FUN34/yaaH family
MWEFRNRNTFGSTAFSTYGAFWLSLTALVAWYASAAGVPTRWPSGRSSRSARPSGACRPGDPGRQPHAEDRGHRRAVQAH